MLLRYWQEREREREKRERERERSDHEDKLIMLEGHKILSILVKLKDIRLDLFYLLNKFELASLVINQTCKQNKILVLF